MPHQRGVFGAAEFQAEFHVDKKLCRARGGCLVRLNFRMNFMLTKNCATQQGGVCAAKFHVDKILCRTKHPPLVRCNLLST